MFRLVRSARYERLSSLAADAALSLNRCCDRLVLEVVHYLSLAPQGSQLMKSAAHEMGELLRTGLSRLVTAENRSTQPLAIVKRAHGSILGHQFVRISGESKRREGRHAHIPLRGMLWCHSTS